MDSRLRGNDIVVYRGDMTDLRVAIAGAGGRMGGANIRAVSATPGLVVHSAFDRPGAPVFWWCASVMAAAISFCWVVVSETFAVVTV